MTEPFIDNANGSIQDPKTGLTWTREDSWQSEAQWFSWDEAIEHARRLCDLNFCGFNDWRLPTSEEARTLYDETQENQDKYGNTIHLNPVFPSGGLATIWLNDGTPGNEGAIFDFKNGEIRPLYKSKSGRMAMRAVRGGCVEPPAENE